MRLIKSFGVAATVGLLYPRMLPIHMFSDDIGFPDERGRLKLPPLIRTSYARMEPHGAYLIGELAARELGLPLLKLILCSHPQKTERLPSSGSARPSRLKSCRICTPWRT